MLAARADVASARSRIDDEVRGRYGKRQASAFGSFLESITCTTCTGDKFYWGCSSHKHGGKSACPNDLRLKRDLIENGLLEGARSALLSRATLEEFRGRVVKRVADQNRVKAPDGKRVAELEGQVGNLADAIASGALRASPAFREMIADLPNAIKRDVDRARATVRQYTGYSIRVESDGKTVRRKAQIHQHPSRCAYLRHCCRASCQVGQNA